MTERVPEFDVYAELAVPAAARPEAIEAAYRSLSRPLLRSVALADDASTDAELQRLRRVLVAHDWLSDPARRRRYDQAVGVARITATRPWSVADLSPIPPSPSATESSAVKAAQAAGSAAAVRAYLADLRQLDVARAKEVRRALLLADPQAYASARRAASALGRQRLGEWLLARETAAAIVEARLGPSELGAQVFEPLADVAAVLAVRDLVPEPLVRLVTSPWTLRDEQPRAARVALPRPSLPSIRVPRPSLPSIRVPRPSLPSVHLPRLTLPAIHVPRPALPSIHMPRLTLPKLTLPTFTMPSVALPKPTLPRFNLPRLAVPKLALPSMSLPRPRRPNVQVPRVQVPRIQVPRVQVPRIRLPRLALPHIHLPELHLPELHLPRVSVPKVSVALPTLPQLHLPQVRLSRPTLPQVSLPRLTLPRVRLPEVHLPRPALPAIRLPELALPRPALASAAATVVVGLAVIGLALAGGGPRFESAVEGITSPPQTAAPAATPATSTPAPATPQPSNASPSSPPGVLDPARIAELQQSAWRTLDMLASLARAGDVVSARPLLGDTAAGLRSSGLRLATFPTLKPADIEISGTDGAWVATAGTSILTSTDGLAWTFDYGSRPLAAYARTLRYGFFITPNDTPRVIHVQVTTFTVRPSSVHLKLTWGFDTDLDAATYGRHQLRVTSITFGDQAYRLPDPPAFTVGGGRTVSITLPISVDPGATGTIHIGVYRWDSGKLIVSGDLKLRLL